MEGFSPNLELSLKALTHEGFGAPNYYWETYIIPNTPEDIRNKITEFALKHDVELDSVKIDRCEKV